MEWIVSAVSGLAPEPLQVNSRALTFVSEEMLEPGAALRLNVPGEDVTEAVPTLKVASVLKSASWNSRNKVAPGEDEEDRDNAKPG